MDPKVILELKVHGPKGYSGTERTWTRRLFLNRRYMDPKVILELKVHGPKGYSGTEGTWTQRLVWN